MLVTNISLVPLPTILLSEMKSSFNRIESVPIRITLARASVGDRVPEQLNKISMRLVLAVILPDNPPGNPDDINDINDNGGLILLDDREYQPNLPVSAATADGSIALVRHTDSQAVFESVFQPYIFDRLTDEEEWNVQVTAAIAYPYLDGKEITQVERFSFKLEAAQSEGDKELWQLFDATY